MVLRIGRLTLEHYLKEKLMIWRCCSKYLGALESNLHLFKYDSIHGVLKDKFVQEKDSIVLQNNKIKFLKESDPEKLPWNQLDIDLVIESTGIFTLEKMQKHLNSGAKKF